MTVNILGLALPFGALLIAGGAKKSPTTPGPSDTGTGTNVTADAANAMCEVRIIEGQQIRCFRSQVVDLTLGALAESYLVPAPGAPSPEVAAYDVVPIASVGKQPGQQTAQQIVAQVAAQGLTVLGSLTLPFPTQSGRQVLIGQPKARQIANAAYKLPYAVLLDRAVASSATAPSVPPYTPGPSAPVVPPPAGGSSSPAPWVPGPSAPPLPPVDEVPGTYTPYSDWDPNIPSSVRSEVEGMLADDSMDPAAVEAAAAGLKKDYPKAAAKLKARAAELRTMRELEATRRGGTPHMIRSGDTGSFLAKHYTGDANRWREIPQANPGMRVVTVKGVSQLSPWSGEILLPASWRCWEKPEPPLQTGAVTTKSGSAPKKKPAGKATGTSSPKQSA